MTMETLSLHKGTQTIIMLGGGKAPIYCKIQDNPRNGHNISKVLWCP